MTERLTDAELDADELAVKVRALRARVAELEREQTRADMRLIEVEAERDALRAALEAIQANTCCDESEMFAANALASVRGDA